MASSTVSGLSSEMTPSAQSTASRGFQKKDHPLFLGMEATTKLKDQDFTDAKV